MQHDVILFNPCADAGTCKIRLIFFFFLIAAQILLNILSYPFDNSFGNIVYSEIVKVGVLGTHCKGGSFIHVRDTL